MRLSLRFILPLAIVLGLIAYAVVPLVDTLTLRWFVRDLDIRSRLIASTMQEPLTELVATGTKARILTLFNRAIQDERLYALGFCDKSGKLVVKTDTYPAQLPCDQLPPANP